MQTEQGGCLEEVGPELDVVTAEKALCLCISLSQDPKRGQGRPGGLPVVRADQDGQGQRKAEHCSSLG